MAEGRALANVAASQTDSVLVAGVAGKVIRVTSAVMNPGGVATTCVFNSKGAGAGTAISPVFSNEANRANILQNDQTGWFETNPGEALTVTTGAGSTTGLLVSYALA